MIMLSTSSTFKIKFEKCSFLNLPNLYFYSFSLGFFSILHFPENSSQLFINLNQINSSIQDENYSVAQRLAKTYLPREDIVEIIEKDIGLQYQAEIKEYSNTIFDLELEKQKLKVEVNELKITLKTLTNLVKE